MTEQQTERFVAALDATRVEPRPEFVAELGQRIREEAASSADTAIVLTDDQREPVRTNLVDYLQEQPDGSTAPAVRNRWSGVAGAVAAMFLVVVGVVVVADGDSGDIVTDPASAPTATDPVTTPTVTDPASEPSATDPVATPTVTVPESSPSPTLVDALGYRWSRVPQDPAVIGSGWMHSVIVGGPGLVAVGSTPNNRNAVVWTSVDGFTWLRVPHDEAVFGSAGINSVAVGGPGLVAVGDINSGVDGEESAVWTSVDGLTWSRHVGVFEGGDPGVVTAGAAGLVALGGDAVWTSVDGITWSRVAHDEAVFDLQLGDGNGVMSVVVGGPGLVAVGSEGLNSDAPTGRARAVVWTSVDGLTWSRVPHDEAVFGGPGDQGMFDVTVGGPGLVAVGEDAQGAPVWTSVDGLTWSRVPPDEEVFASHDPTGYPRVKIDALIAAGPGLVAVGGDAVWTSVDGVTWSRVRDDEAVFGGVDDGGMLDVTVGGPGLVAVGVLGSNAAVWVATPEN